MPQFQGPWVSQNPGKYQLNEHVLYRYQETLRVYPRIDITTFEFVVGTYDPSSFNSFVTAISAPMFLHPQHLYLPFAPRLWPKKLECLPFLIGMDGPFQQGQEWLPFTAESFRLACYPIDTCLRVQAALSATSSPCPALLDRMGPQPTNYSTVEFGQANSPLSSQQEALRRRNSLYIQIHSAMLWVRGVQVLTAALDPIRNLVYSVMTELERDHRNHPY